MTAEGHLEYYVLKQFAPNAEIWVARLNAEDPAYIYNNEIEAQAKCDELAIQDPSRRYKVSAQ